MNINTLELALKLMAEESITPNDANCQKILTGYLQKLGFHIQHLNNEIASNLWACLDPTQPCDLVFAGHTDVVPPGDLSEWIYPPFAPTVVDNTLYGRGACDMKVALACMISATADFLDLDTNKPPNIGFLITSSEEGDATPGTIYALKNINNFHSKYCIVGEPTSSEKFGDIVKIGRRGSITFNIKFTGKQGHVAYPEKAHNPNDDMIKFMHELNNVVWDHGSNEFPASNLEITQIESGVAVNVIPASSYCAFNLRFNPESTTTYILDTVHNLLKDSQCDYNINHIISAKPFLNKPGTLYDAISSAIETECKVQTRTSTCGGTSDARFLTSHCSELVEFGLCNASAHQINEHISLDSLNSLTKVYLKTLNNLFNC